MLDILYTESEGHNDPNHFENSNRVKIPISALKTNLKYNQYIKSANTYDRDLISSLIIKAQGEKVMRTFDKSGRNLICLNCNEVYQGDNCPNCNSTECMWYSDRDTYVTNKSLDDIYNCISVLFTAMDNIINGSRYQYLLTRPPGHHCYNKANGFCLINNVYLLSEYAISIGFSKVMIVDYDYHHADGTQKLVRGKKDRYLISIHAYSNKFRIYPGTGSAGENRENIVNIPLYHENPEDKEIFTDDYCISLLKDEIITGVNNFHPNLIIISNGLDGHKDDPLAGLNLTNKFFKDICKVLKIFNIPLIYVLEGGYNPNVIRDVSEEIIEELIKPVDSIGL